MVTIIVQNIISRGYKRSNSISGCDYPALVQGRNGRRSRKTERVVSENEEDRKMGIRQGNRAIIYQRRFAQRLQRKAFHRMK